MARAERHGCGDRQRPTAARATSSSPEGVVSEMEIEIEKRVESEPNGSCVISVLCESTAVAGSVGGLRGTEKSILVNTAV